jgi:hypothetical protein
MNHGACTDSKCYASQIDNVTYLTKHTSSGCDCLHFGVDPVQQCSILKAGNIPRFIIEPFNGSGKDFQVRVIDYGPFVAISHVWAHGLGNAKSNSLPLCQLQRLRSYINALGEKVGIFMQDRPIPFWIDTLNVPLERESRKLALKALTKTYADAIYVLVLNEELYQTSGESSMKELCLRMIICA